MEPKYRTLIQAAVMIIVLAFIVHQHDGRMADETVAQNSAVHP